MSVNVQISFKGPDGREQKRNLENEHAWALVQQTKRQ